MTCEISITILSLLQTSSAENTVTKTKHNYNSENVKLMKEPALTLSNTKHRTHAVCVKLQYSVKYISLSLYPQQLALNSPTSSDRSVSLVHLRTISLRVCLFCLYICISVQNCVITSYKNLISSCKVT
jgi:hypothetical protein